jgi:hypothetical protein
MLPTIGIMGIDEVEDVSALLQGAFLGAEIKNER